MALTKHLLLASATVLAVGGYALIWLSCPYGGLAHIMTGLTRIPGTSILVPYRMILSFAVYLILRASYGYVRPRFPERTSKPFADPLLLGCAAVGIAVIGFLATSYPCPHPLSAALVLSLDIYIGTLSVPYVAVLVVAAAVLLWAFVCVTRRAPDPQPRP
jgi:hypothetical protein